MRDRADSLVRPLASAAALAALLAGPPWLLVRHVGWPLPRDLPEWSAFGEVLRGARVDDAVIVTVLAVICWGAWLAVVAASAAELNGWRRGRTAARVPLGGLIQPLVHRLVLSAMLLAGSSRLVSPALVPSVAVSAPPAAVTPSATVNAEARPVIDGLSPEDVGTYTVRSRDCLWSIAAEHLGDGSRWREVWDLNRNRTFADGRRFTDPDMIHPGWQLRVPAAIGPEGSVQASEDPAPASSRAAVREGGAPDDAAAPQKPSPGRPGVDRRAGGAGGSDSESGGRPGLAPGGTARSTERTTIGLAGGSLLAAGVVGLLERLRRRQLRNRRPAHGVPEALPEERAVETALRVAARGDVSERVDVAMRAMAARMAESSGPLPAIELVLAGPGAVEVMLSAGLDAPAGPFDVSGGDRVWTLPGSVPPSGLQDETADRAFPAPALVTVGTIGDRQMLIDLEAAPATAVESSAEQAAALVWSVAAELAGGQLGSDAELVVVGGAMPSLDRLERVRVVANLAEVLDPIERAARAARDDLEALGKHSTLAARVDNPAEPWAPTVVLLTGPVPQSELERLLAAANRGTALAVLAAAASSEGFSRWITVEGEIVHLEPCGVSASLSALDPERLGTTDGLIRTALAEGGGEDLIVASPPPESGPATDGLERLRIEPDEAGTDGRILVRVLGGVDVLGAPDLVRRRRSLELVAYLALHRSGVDEGRLRTALWPEAAPSRAAFNQTVSRARQPLGCAADGSLHLPRVAEGDGFMYRLGPAVKCDAALLEAAYAAARRDPTPAALDDLELALELVRGIPFEGTRGGWEWAYVEGHAARLSAIAADAAHLVARHALAAGDTARALHAAGRGLAASPGDEVLYRDRMEAHDLAGNTVGVEATMAELRRTVEEGEPYDAIHPETIACYERLTRRSLPRAG